MTQLLRDLQLQARIRELERLEHDDHIAGGMAGFMRMETHALQVSNRMAARKKIRAVKVTLLQRS